MASRKSSGKRGGAQRSAARGGKKRSVSKRSASARGGAKRAGMKRGAAKRSGAKRGGMKRAGAKKSASRRGAASQSRSTTRSPVARVKRVTREVVQQATTAVSSGVETLRDLGGNLVDRVRSAT